MTGWLLDTNVLSELYKPKPEPAVEAFMAGEALESLHVSIVTLAEIRYGITCQSDPLRRTALTAWLDHTVRPRFVQRILPVTEDIMLLWRVLVAAGRAQNHSFSQPDLIIAATALHHGLTLVTRDTSDFDRTGVKLLNPWPKRKEK